MTITSNKDNCIGNASSGGSSAPVIDELNITPSTSAQEITAPEGVDGYSPVNVAAVTASIDANIVAGNIKKDVQILGVTGTLESSPIKTWYNWQDKVVSRNFTVGTGASVDDTTGLFTSSAGKYIYKSSQSMRGTTFDFVFKLKFNGTLSDSLDTNVASFATSASDYSSTNNALRLVSTGLKYNWYYATGSQASITVLPYNTPSAIPTDTWFWIKINISSEGTKSYYSTDGQTWTQQDSSPRRDFYSGDLTFFPYSVFGVDTGSGFTVTYLLFDCKADVNGNLYWQPYSETINGQVYTLTETPDTSSIVYDNTSTQSALTITSIGSDSITCSDTNTYTRNSAGDTSALTVTANGTYNVTEYEQVIINVS